jgi:tetratricopeptide (TPR) repeat protein
MELSHEVPMSKAAVLSELQRAHSFIVAGRLADAAQIANALIARDPMDARSWHLLSTAHAKAGRLQDAVQCVQRAMALLPADPGLHLQYGQYLIAMGQRREALNVASIVAAMHLGRADWNDAVGTLFTYCEEPARALTFFERAATLEPNNAQYLYNLATAQRMVGDLAAAEVTLNRVIAHQPSNVLAYYTRADLRTQTQGANHVDEMVLALNTRIRNVNDRIMMCFAIAKELDDVANYEMSFRYLGQACDQQRRMLTYSVEDDVSTIDRIIQLHDHAAIENRRGIETTECIFVAGLPRTGTTLVEQILSSHSAVYGAGELPAFPAEMIKAVQRLAGRMQVGKREFVELALKVDAAELGRSYLEATRPQTGHTPFFVDKLPTNYLYAGMIRRALPNSRIIVLARDPMDSCFAMYRTLFSGAYPFSYDLSELAVYYAAWHRLIRHWQSVLGESLLVVRYEDLVLDYEATTRRLLAHCGLRWDDACLAFQKQTKAVTTASAVQVRRPLYLSSVGKWRHYQEYLQPLSESLKQLEPPQGWHFA